MFRKKETNLKSASRDIPARFVKKDGVITDFAGSFPNNVSNHSSHTTNRSPKYVNERTIPSTEISESYISSKQSRLNNSAPNSTKGARRKFAPSFLLRKKKTNTGNQHNYENIDIEEEDVTDIAFYDDLVSEQESINPVMLSQLDDSQLSTIEVEPFGKLYKSRLQYVLNNYRRPPPYPGTKREKKKSLPEASQLQGNVDTPLLRQLLKDKNLNDNASMNNYWQASPSHQSQALKQMQVENSTFVTDKLVSRTQEIVSSQTRPNDYGKILNPSELYEKRKLYYMQSLTNLKDDKQTIYENDAQQQDTVSAVYPAKDYETSQQTKGLPTSASVPNLSIHTEFTNFNECTRRQPRAHIEPAEMEALIAHYRKTSLDSFEPYDIPSSSSESVSLYSQGSPSYVPPSPYLNAEIPEWLQVYAKASPELDKYLKWSMFRHPELDCWQTMLKRLYKKELEQVVLWFEEYRLALQQELENRQYAMGIKPPVGNLKKTEV